MMAAGNQKTSRNPRVFSHHEDMPCELEAKVVEEGKKARAAAHGNHG
jgi:hypothetical protein